MYIYLYIYEHGQREDQTNYNCGYKTLIYPKFTNSLRLWETLKAHRGGFGEWLHERLKEEEVTLQKILLIYK